MADGVGMIYSLCLHLVSAISLLLSLVTVIHEGDFFLFSDDTIDCPLGYFMVWVHLVCTAWPNSPSPLDCFGSAESSRCQVIIAEISAVSQPLKSTGGPAV